MAFDGRDYDIAFNQALRDLPKITDPAEVERRLTGIEWKLKEALDGAFMLTAMILGLIVVIPFGLLIRDRDNWWGLFAGLILYVVSIVVIFAVQRLALYNQVSGHITGGRRFGDPILRR